MRDFPDETGPMHSWSKLAAMPNAEAMLRELSKTAVCCLATNAKDSDKSEIVKAIKRLYLDQYFSNIFCYREIGYAKPAREYFDWILAKLKVEKPEVVMIGDDLEKDVMGAKNYGIEAILYDPENKHTDYSGARIRDLQELMRYHKSEDEDDRQKI